MKKHLLNFLMMLILLSVSNYGYAQGRLPKEETNSIDAVLYFPADSDQLNFKDKLIIKNIASVLKEGRPEFKCILRGYVSNTSRDKNLNQIRLKAVERLLLKYGVNPAQIEYDSEPKSYYSTEFRVAMLDYILLDLICR